MAKSITEACCSYLPAQETWHKCVAFCQGNLTGLNIDAMFFSHQALRQRLYLVPSSQIKQWGNTTGKIWQWACSASLLPPFFPLGRKLLWRFKCIYCNIGRGSCGAVPPPLVAAPAGALGTWPWGHIGALPPTALAVWGFCLPACSGASLACCGVTEHRTWCAALSQGELQSQC